MDKAEYSATPAEIAEVLQMLQLAETQGAFAHGSVQKLRSNLRSKYSVAL